MFKFAGVKTVEEINRLRPVPPKGYWWKEYISTLSVLMFFSVIFVLATLPLTIVLGYGYFLIYTHILVLVLPILLAAAIGGNMGPNFIDRHLGIHYHKKRLAVWNKWWFETWAYRWYLEENEKNMKNEEISEEFKEGLKKFFGEMFDGSADFVNNIHNCFTYGELKDSLENDIDFLVEELGYQSDCESCEGKDNEIEDLSDALGDLESEFEMVESDMKRSFTPVTFDDEYKLEAFKEAKDKYSVVEMEELLK